MDVYASYTFYMVFKRSAKLKNCIHKYIISVIMQLHTFPWNLPGVMLSCMILTYLCKIHNGLVFFFGSPDVMRPDKDKDKHCQIIFHNDKFIL